MYALQIINITTTLNFFFKKKGKLGLEKPTTLSFEEKGTLSCLDKLKLFSAKIETVNKRITSLKRYSGHELWKKSSSLQKS